MLRLMTSAFHSSSCLSSFPYLGLQRLLVMVITMFFKALHNTDLLLIKVPAVCNNSVRFSLPAASTCLFEVHFT